MEKIEKAISAPEETYQTDLPIAKFTKAEVSRAIKNLKSNKAPGYDLITGTVLKHLPQEGITYLTYLYNAALWTGFFPPQWKIAQNNDDIKTWQSIE